MLQHGLLDLWITRAFRQTNNTCTTGATSSPQTLLLRDVFVVYLMLIGGVAMAALILVVEISYNRYILLHNDSTQHTNEFHQVVS